MSTPPVFYRGPGPVRLRPEATDATRYLCAAAYLDEAFAQAVLDEVLRQPHRAVAPSHGISLGPVIRHCLAAQRRRLLRDSIVAVAIVVGLLASFSTGLGVIVTFFAAWLIVRAVRLLGARQPVAAIVYFVVGTSLLSLLMFAVLIPILLSAGSEGLDPFLFLGLPVLPQVGPLRLLLWLVLLLGIWATYFAYRTSVHSTIALDLTPQGFDPQRAPSVDPGHEQRLAYIEQAQRGNVTVYSQQIGSRPFIGFGEVTQEWSLAAPLIPAASESPQIFDYLAGGGGSNGVTAAPDTSPVIPFDIEELYEAIRSGMAELSDPRLPPDEVVPQLSVRDRIFVAGQLSPSSPFLDQSQPRYRLADQDIKHLQRAERGPVRHYQSVRMAAWGGELEVTTFFHATVRGRMLYVEFIATVVPGIRAAYHEIDTYNRLDLASGVRAAVNAVGDVFRSPLALLAVAASGLDAIRRALDGNSEANRINRQLMFDYGCRSSVRELAADFRNTPRLQLYDANERVSVVERRLLQVLVSFLQEHHYDVSAVAGQAATVINNSTAISNSNTFNNSTLNSSPVVAGNSASAYVTAGGPAAKSPAAGRTA